MNVFEQIHQVATARTDTFDELRIIARDAHNLPGSDRDVIKRAADELEEANRLLVRTQAALIESQARQIATNDQLLAIKSRMLKVEMQMFSGPVKLTVIP